MHIYKPGLEIMNNKKINKLKRDMASEIKKIEILTLRIDTSENKIKQLANKIIEMENENE
jgi:hypothetical protein